MLILGLRGKPGAAVLCSDTKRKQVEGAKHLLCIRKEELSQKKSCGKRELQGATLVSEETAYTTNEK